MLLYLNKMYFGNSKEINLLTLRELSKLLSIRLSLQVSHVTKLNLIHNKEGIYAKFF